MNGQAGERFSKGRLTNLENRKKNKVYIIGAGPGDPGLLTLRAAACLREADVIVYDYLVDREILRHAREDARFIYVGKQGGDHTVTQERLNEILVEEAKEGHTVARLKGGDPFVFGRGGEEAEVLFRAEIPFEIVPGVTSAIAVPAYAGIPLTHREFTSSVAFVTGHEDPDKKESRVHWGSLAAIETLVFLMGVKNLGSISAGLREHGKSPDTPCALIRWGTTADQETVTGTLETIERQARERGMTPPAVLVVGEVVRLRAMMNWFETKPLFGKGVVITRPAAQAGEMARLLRDEGARPIHFPVIQVRESSRTGPLDEALGRLEAYRWVVFTSANGVRFFLKRLREKGKDLRALKGVRIAAIGPATAKMIEAYGIGVDLVPPVYVSEGLVASFESVDLGGERVLLPRAEEARDILPDGLKGMGAAVDVVPVYRTVRADTDRAVLEKEMEQGRVDVLTFTSPSTVKNFFAIMGERFALPGHVRVASIGPVTAAALKKRNVPIHVMEEVYSVPGLVDALRKYYERKTDVTDQKETGR